MTGETPPSRRVGTAGATDAEVTAIAETLDSANPTSSHTAELRFDAGHTIGRYVVLGRLGAGGMGVVFAAYDPELDRRVAVKLVLPAQSGTDSSKGRSRLLREAQAMARLTHPNVITVHDVGTVQDRVFVAMEYVEGETLSEWTKQGPPWRDSIEHYLAAARGLTAAHAAGLVHRDFKPDNVMLGTDGRVRVMDFGLARSDEVDPSDAAPAMLDDLDASGASPVQLTRTGALMGTPAYMSPEQHLGTPADARSDQFSFCVSLWEALFGERPFAGNTLARLALAVSEGEIREPPKDAGVPLAIRRVLTRGLATDPTARWPSMAALATQLEAVVRPNRRAPMWAAAGLALTGAAVVIATRAPAPAPLCAATGAALDEVWNDAARERLRGAFVATSGADFGGDAASLVIAEIDAWAQSWAESRRDSCEATHVRHEQSDRLLDLRVRCMDDALGSLNAVLSVFATPDRDVVRNAMDVSGGLASIVACSDTERLTAAVPLPADPKVVARIEALRGETQRGRSLHDAGQYALAAEVLEAALTEIRTLEYPPLLARALVRLGAVEREKGDLDRATEHLDEAYLLSVEHSVPERAANAALQLAHVTGYARKNAELGRVWHESGAAWARQTKDEDLIGAAIRIEAALHFSAGRYEQALESQREMIEVSARIHGERSGEVASATSTLALMAHAASKLDEAERAARKAIEVMTEVYGAEHPDTASAKQNLGLVLHSRGEYQQAIDLWRETLAVYERVLDPGSMDLAQTLGNIADAQSWLGDNPSSLETYARAEAIYVKTLGSRHARVGQLKNSVAAIYKEMGDLPRAKALYEEALAMLQETLGPDHPDTVFPLNNLGNLYHAMGEEDAAREAYEKTYELLVAKNGPDHVTVSYPLTGLGYVAQAEGDYDSALESYNKALAIKEKNAGAGSETTAGVQHSISTVHLATKRWKACVEHAVIAYDAYTKSAPHGMFAAAAAATLSRCRWHLAKDGAQRATALALADEARRDLAAAGDGASTDLANLDAWLAER